MAPSVARLDADDVRNVCYHSFPDSNSGCRGDTQFSFRIRKASAPPPSPVPTAAKSPPTARAAASSSGCPFPRRSSKTHMFGSVYFRQVPDPSSKRGYYQKVPPSTDLIPPPTSYPALPQPHTECGRAV